MSKGLRRLCHHNDPELLDQLLSLLTSNLEETAIKKVDSGVQQLLTLFCFSIWNNTPPENTLYDNIFRLKRNRVLMAELCDLLPLLREQTDTLVYRPRLPFACPLFVHACYTRDASPTGQRYIHHEKQGNHILLFVREQKTTNNLACPYYFLGPASYIRHKGSRPMSIIWRLKYPMPAGLTRTTRRLAVA